MTTVEFANNYFIVFKYRDDWSTPDQLVLYRVYNRGTLGKYISLLTSTIEQLCTNYIYFVRICSPDATNIRSIVNDIRFMGRVTPEELCMYFSKHGYTFTIDVDKIPEKSWCFYTGIVREVTRFGYKITIS